MNYAQIQTFMGYLGVNNVEHGGKWARCSCPLAPWKHGSGHDKSPSFGVSIEDGGRSHCNCFSCGTGGPLDEVLLELMHFNKVSNYPMDLASAFKLLESEQEGGYTLVEDWSEFGSSTEKPIAPWPESWLSSFKPASSVGRAMQYLVDVRRIHPKTITDFDIRYDIMRDAVCFPIRDRQGRFVGMRGRYLQPKGEVRYHDYLYNDSNNTSLVWHGEDMIDWSQPVVVTEGSLDRASVYRYYRNVMTPMSISASKSKLKLLFNAHTVICFFDNDMGGEQGYERMRKLLQGQTVVKRIDYPPYLDPKQKDPNSLEPEVIRMLLSSHVKLDEFSP